jgi:hypothetical protein
MPPVRCLRLFVLLVSIASLLPAFQASSTSTVVTGGGQVQGKTVLDSDGSVVAGVTVTLIQIKSTPGMSSTSPTGNGTVTTTVIAGASTSGGTTNVTASAAKDGTFSAAGLATGQYAVCVQDPAAEVIDPCLWSDSRTTVGVTAGSLSSGLVVRVKKASIVSVRLNDTAQALVQRPGDQAPPHVLVGAFDSRGIFHPARQAQKDASGVSYQIPIPVDSPIRVIVSSAQVKLASSTNAPLPAQGYSTTFVQPSSQSATNSFTFDAVGRN